MRSWLIFALLERRELVLVLVDVLGDLLEQIIANIFKCLHICADCPNGGIDLAQRLEHEVLALILQHGHDFGAVSVVLLLLLLLGKLELLELLVCHLQFFQLLEHLLQLLLPYRHTYSNYSIVNSNFY